jgi:hypothetical protein
MPERRDAPDAVVVGHGRVGVGQWPVAHACEHDPPVGQTSQRANLDVTRAGEKERILEAT